MSKITDASFIAHQYTSVSRKVLEKANRYTLFENRLRSCPILPSVPHSGRYLDRSIGMAKQLPRASVWRSPTWRSPRSKLEVQKSPPANAAYPGTPGYAAFASSGLSLFRDINHVRRRLQRAPAPLLPVDGIVAMQVEPTDELHKGDELPAVGVAGEHEIDA